jgi:peptide deformylase
MLRPIVKYGAGVLHEPARDVETITPEITTLIDDMIETMYAAPGVGLAAPQVGEPLRIFVVDVSLGRDAAGLLARAFQHEMDHLDGRLFVDRLRGIKRDLIVRKIRKLTRAGEW